MGLLGRPWLESIRDLTAVLYLLVEPIIHILWPKEINFAWGLVLVSTGLKDEFVFQQPRKYRVDADFHIKGKRIPFPFSLSAGVLFLLLAPIVAVVYGPVTAFHARRVKRRERTFVTQMQDVGRLIPWDDALAQIEAGRGSLIDEHVGLGGPYRVWWTPDDIAAISPFAPCFVPFPYVEDDRFDEFCVWCAGKYMDPKTDNAKLVDTEATDENGIPKILEDYMQRQRCVSIGPVSGTPGMPV